MATPWHTPMHLISLLPGSESILSISNKLGSDAGAEDRSDKDGPHVPSREEMKVCRAVVFLGVSRGSSKVSLGSAIPYQSTTCGRPTPGWPNHRPDIGYP